MTAPRTDPQSTVPVEPLSAEEGFGATMDGPNTHKMAAPSNVTNWTVVRTTREVASDDGRRMESRDEWWHVPTFVVEAIIGPAARASQPITATAREALNLLNSLGIYGPNIIHAEQGMHPDGKNSVDRTWDGPGTCVCRLPWPCEAKALGDLLAALPVREDEPTGIDATIDVDVLAEAIWGVEAARPDHTAAGAFTWGTFDDEARDLFRLEARTLAAEYERLARLRGPA